MTDDPNYLPEILARPHDDGPRLIYADFLDDKGDTESSARAEFIRVQCALAGIPRDAPERLNLRNREEVLLQTYWRSWLKPSCQALGEPLPVVASQRPARYALDWIESERRTHVISQGSDTVTPYLMAAQFRRGFMTRVMLMSKTNKPATYLERLFDRCPIDGLALLQYTLKDLESVLKIAGPHRLRGLELLYFNEHLIRPVVSANGLEDITELVLNFCQDQSFDVAGALLREPVFRTLKILTLRGCHVDDESLDRLLVHPMLANVERLTFERCQLRTPTAKTILDRLTSTKLEWLDLSDNSFSGRAVSSLAARFGNVLQMRNREFHRPELFHH